MSVSVEALLYSGRPNPKWSLTHKEAAQLRELLAQKPQSTNERAPIGGLGYSGFSIFSTIDEERTTPDSIPREMHCFSGIIDLSLPTVKNIRDDGSLEEFLLHTGKEKGALSEEAAEHILSQIQMNKSKTVVTLAELSLAAPSVPLTTAPPIFNPGKWNNDPFIRRNNNCYNYGCDRITNTFAQPGRASGHSFHDIDCGDVGKGAKSDGLLPTAPATPADGWLAALVIWPGHDYHWYRCDEGGRWSHKPGQTPARNTDNRGALIDSPERCDRGPYTIFCSYYQVIPQRVTIK